MQQEEHRLATLEMNSYDMPLRCLASATNWKGVEVEAEMPLLCSHRG